MFGKKIDLQLLIIAAMTGILMGEVRAAWWVQQRAQLTSEQLTGSAVVTEIRHQAFSWQATLAWDKPGPFPSTSAGVLEELPVGTLISATCDLQPQETLNWMDQGNSALAQGRGGECGKIDFKKIPTTSAQLTGKLLSHPSRFLLTTLAARWRGALQQHITHSYNPPVSWLASGLLIGERGDWSTAFNQLFQRVGLSHIVALSGWNVTILSGVVLWLLTRAGCSARTASAGGLGVVVGFVILTGASASLVRAALMFGVCVLVRFLSRPQPAARVLLMAAALMVLAQPAILVWDVSFQLSMLATLALVAGGWSFLDSFEAPVWEVSQTVRTSLAVTLVTFPYMVWRFNRFSLVAIPLNILILPMLPLATAGAALGLVPTWLGMHSFTWSWLCSLPMQLIINSAHFAAQLPWSNVSWQ